MALAAPAVAAMNAKLHLTTEGNWCELRRPAGASAPRRALFLDRDGVLIEDRGYIGNPADVALIEGAAALLDAVARRGWLAVIVTNQSGIARGCYRWPDFAAVQAELYRKLGDAAAAIHAVLACPFFPDHPWRKPAPGMLLAAAKLLPIALGASWIVGDRDKDLEAGHAAGLAGGLLLTHESGASTAGKTELYRSVRVRSLADAARFLADLR